jgi:hypothetical protein
MLGKCEVNEAYRDECVAADKQEEQVRSLMSAGVDKGCDSPDSAGGEAVEGEYSREQSDITPIADEVIGAEVKAMIYLMTHYTVKVESVR